MSLHFNCLPDLSLEVKQKESLDFNASTFPNFPEKVSKVMDADEDKIIYSDKDTVSVMKIEMVTEGPQRSQVLTLPWLPPYCLPLCQVAGLSRVLVFFSSISPELLEPLRDSRRKEQTWGIHLA